MQVELEPVSSNNHSSYFRRIELNRSSYDYSVEIIIDNDDFIEGYYYLNITAFDGNNYSVAGIKIYVEFIKNEFLGSLIANEVNNQTMISWLNLKDGSNSVYGSAPVSFGGLAVNGKDKLFIIAEREERVITARKKNDNVPVWSFSDTKTSGTYQYKTLKTIDNLIYALSFNNQIEVYSRDGNRLNTISTYFRPIIMAKTSDRIYTIEQDPTNRNYLGIYTSLGIQLSNIRLDFIPVGIEVRISNDLYVLGNNSGKGVLMEYKSQSSAFNTIKNFNYKILSSAYCNGKLYYNSDVGVLYEFSVGQNNGIQRGSGILADLMKCNEETSNLYFNHQYNATLGVLNLDRFTLETKRTYSSKVLGIEFLYSR